MNEQVPHILLVEDEEAHAELVRRAFEAHQKRFHLTIAGSVGEARACLAEALPRLIITDLRLPDGLGTSLLPAEGEEHTFPLIVMTAQGDQAAAVEAMKAGALDYLVKSGEVLSDMPHIAERVLREWQSITERRTAEEKLRQYREHLEELVVQRTAEAKRANELLNQAQKMDAIGRLAGGVAHDLNNLLTPIMCYAQLELEKLPLGDSSSGIQEIYKAAELAANLTHKILALSRSQVIEAKVINLNDLMMDMDKMLRRLLSEDIELVTLPSDSLDPIEADPIEIELVILNLAVNARDAMPNGGTLSMQTTNIILDEAYALQHLNASPGPYVMLTVTDTGCGMTEEVKSKIFEPFFTTKEVGKGTGLGLATCFGIARRSGGHIEVHSELGKGTTFKLYLPRTESVIQVSRLSDQSNQSSESLCGTETVLLVEDEPLVRNLVAQVLRDQGYTVLEAANGIEAISIAEKHQAKDIDLVLTDMVMPLMSGAELAEHLRTMHPSTNVLYMSGYSDHNMMNLGDQGPTIPFIRKPFLPAELLCQVREMLNQNIPAPV